MASQSVQQDMTIAVELPARVADGTTQSSPRGTPYKDQFVTPIWVCEEQQADEGSFFVATNPTPGTKIDYGSAGTQASFSDTVPFFLYKNDAALGSGKRMYLKDLKLIQIGGTAPASTTSVQVAIKTDNGNRFPTSAASTYTLVTAVNCNRDSSRTPFGKLYVPNGAVATIPASTSGALLAGRVQLKGGPTLLLDQYEIVFGTQDNAGGAGYLTTVAKYSERVEPVILGPQQWGVVHLWMPAGATNAFSFEFSTSWRER